MIISKRQNGDLNAIITIEVKPEDYTPKFEETIKEYRKNINLPGFRQGQVPAGIIKKKFGKEVLAEELNKLLGKELINYLRDNKIDTLGTPIPIDNENQNLEVGNEFTFNYEIGIAPAFEFKLPNTKVPYYLIKVDDKMVDDDINDLRRRYGKFSNPESADEKSILYGEFHELENGEIKANGNYTTTTLSIEMIRDEEEKKKFIGIKKDESLVFNPMKAIRNEAEVSAMLRVDRKNEALNSEYRFTVKTVNMIEKAELNQELFDKAIGDGIVSGEEEFRAKIREGIISYFGTKSDEKLRKDLKNILLQNNNLTLPDDFLKRMLKNTKENAEVKDFDHEYYHVAEDLKWHLIESKISSTQAFELNENDVVSLAKMIIAQQFAQYGVPAPEDDKLTEMAHSYLAKDDNAEKLERNLISQKVFDYLKANVKLDMIELPHDEYVEKLKEKTEHEVHHH